MYRIDFKKPCHIHFIGIGGISMSGLAEVLLGGGFTVSGSDSAPSALTDALADKGASIVIGQAAENITDDIDAVVYTAAIHPDNPEYAAAAAKGLPMLTRADLLGQIMENYPTSIAVAGTHGKTTTTSMAAHILMAAGMDPTVSVGGILPAIGGNIRVGTSGCFLTEACEYTNSYHSLKPLIAMILNIDADHLDFFRDLDDITDSFHHFARLVPAGGVVIADIDSPRVPEILTDLAAGVITVSLEGPADYSASDIVFDESGCASFTALERGQALGRFTLHVPGRHNVGNALAAIAMGRYLELTPEVIAEGLDGFTGTDRRFEYKGTLNGVTIIDDYAHHPTEIAATIASARGVVKGNLWVIFQPHTYSRTKSLFDRFVEELAKADHVILADIYAARETDTLGVSSAALAEALRAKGVDAIFFPTFAEIEEYVRTHCINNDLLITMGAGNVTNIGPALLSKA